MSERRALDVGDMPASEPARKEWWRWMLAPAMLGAILGAIPTAIDFYKAFDYDIGSSQVQHAEEHRQLWIKNFECAQSMTYQQVRTEDGIQVQVGACSNGDVLIEVQSPGTERVLEWIPLNRIQLASTVSNISLVSTAFAAIQSRPSAPAAEPKGQRLAQASVMCQARQGNSKIIRIVNENGKCFREEIEMMKGKVVKRTPVDCGAKCN